MYVCMNKYMYIYVYIYVYTYIDIYIHLHQDHVSSTTHESFGFRKYEFDEMPCELESTESPRSFEKNPTPP